MIEKMGVSDYVNRQIRQLSGDNNSVYSSQRALVQEADIYLMDEPFRASIKQQSMLLSPFTRNESARQNSYRRAPRFKYGTSIFRLGNDGEQTNRCLWPCSRYVYRRSHRSAPTARGGLYDYTQSYTTQMVLLGTALLGLASGIAGTFAVLRKESLIGDGLPCGITWCSHRLLADRHKGH